MRDRTQTVRISISIGSMCLRNPVKMQNFASQLCYGSARRLFCFAVVQYCENNKIKPHNYFGAFHLVRKKRKLPSPGVLCEICHQD